MYTKNNYYTIVDFPKDNQNYGTYEGKYPKSAANKAFSKLLQFIKTTNNLQKDDFLGKFLVFVIKNINTNKEYKYIGNRIKLHNPIEKIINGRKIIYRYKNVIGKYNPELDKI
jgi:hypothetical protein